MIISFATVAETSEKPFSFREMPIVSHEAINRMAASAHDFRINSPSKKAQLELCSHLADERAADVAERPLAIAVQLRTRCGIDAEEGERFQYDRIATPRHRPVVDLEGDAERHIIIDGEPI